MKLAFAAAAAAAVVMVFVSGAAAHSVVPDQRLADSLVVAKSDVPAFWIEWKSQGNPLLGCIANVAASRATAQARSIVGTPNSGVSSFAIVMPHRSQAHVYYRRAVRVVAKCVRQALTATHPTHVRNVQPLTAGRYGRQSGAWRIRFLSGSERHAVDWAVVNTGRAVLVEVFTMGLYDTHWSDISAAHGLGGSVGSIERHILANASRRVAA